MTIFLSARYANPDNTVIVVSSDDSGDIAVLQNTPEWEMAIALPVAVYEPPTIVVSQVSAAQAEIQLWQEPDPSGAFPTLWARVENIAADHPYRPVQIFFRKANNWDRYSPYVQAIAAEIWPDPAQAETMMTAIFGRAYLR